MREHYKHIECDLCGKSLDYTERKQYDGDILWIDRYTNKSIPSWKSIVIPVVFLTEQNEGYPCENPYFSDETLDMCSECYQKFIESYPITAKGAQGYNKYEWRKK